MRTPKEWNVTLLEGIVTSEMLDACCLAATARIMQWKDNYKKADELLEKRPKSKAARAKFKNAERMVDFYSRQKKTLLSAIEPLNILSVQQPGKDFRHRSYYASYRIARRDWYCAIDQEYAFELMDNYDIDVVKLDSMPRVSYETHNIVSHYFVNRVIATISLYGENYTDVGAFDAMAEQVKPASEALFADDHTERNVYIASDCADVVIK